MAWKFADMEMDDESQMDAVMPMPMPEKPQYPFGLRICLTEQELSKLGIDEDPDVGDYIDIRAFASVTSVSRTDGPNGPCRRIELQIEKLALESESDE